MGGDLAKAPSAVSEEVQEHVKLLGEAFGTTAGSSSKQEPLQQATDLRKTLLPLKMRPVLHKNIIYTSLPHLCMRLLSFFYEITRTFCSDYENAIMNFANAGKRTSRW